MKTNSTDAAQPVRRSWPRRFFSWKTLRRFLLGIFGLFTLVVLLATIDSWRGRRLWEKCKAEHEAKGEVLDWRKVIPLPIPDEKNFAATPLIREIFTANAANRVAEKAGRTNLVMARISRMREDWGKAAYDAVPPRGNIAANRLCDLDGWAGFYLGNTNYPQVAIGGGADPAKIILTALSKFDPELDELKGASSRPLTRFDVNYDTGMPFAILIPHVTEMRNVNRVVALRAMARLADGKGDAAFSDWKLCMRLCDAMRSEPFLISHLVTIAILNDSLAIIQEGLARHAWTPAQLAEIERTLAGINMLAELKLAFLSERAASLTTMDYLKGHARDDEEFFRESGLGPALRFAPMGWVSYNQVTMCDWYDRFTLRLYDEKARRIHPQVDEELEREISRTKAGFPFNILEMRRSVLVALMMPALGRAGKNSARMQTVVDHMRIACAMERQRIANGSATYPEKLDELVPQFLDELPHDPVNGQPYKYRREGSDGYVVYGVGSNEKDDGGTVVMSEGNRTEVDRNAGDWVWRWPPKAVTNSWTPPPPPKPLVKIAAPPALPAHSFWLSARARAATAQELNNAKQILMALIDYAAAHDGKYPQTLSALTSNQSAGVFTSPLDPASPPQAEGFVLLTPGASLEQVGSPATNVVLESKFALPGRDRVRGFADGHVE